MQSSGASAHPARVVKSPMRRFVAVSLLALTTCVTCVHAQTPDKSGVSPSVISLPSGPGSIEGLGESFEPQLNTGTSTYSVGIDVPPGRAGFQPSLALSYNSGLGNSFVGIGWTLAIPDIRRQTDKGFPDYNSQDTFLFQGEELVPLSDGFYRCENESGFQRFQPIDTNGDGAFEAWEMVERNGVRHTFGRFRGEESRWSAVVHPAPPSGAGDQPFDQTYCWRLDRSTDLHGNRIEYEYTLGIGKLYPVRITYSHTENRYHEILFDYEERPDVFDDYRPTFSSRIDRRLSEIVVRSLGKPVRRYRLDYEHSQEDLSALPLEEQAARAQAFDLGVSVLKRFTQFDRSGNTNNYLPPLRFYYSFLQGNLDHAVVQKVQTPQGDLPALDIGDSSGHVQIADINADGLPDLFSTKPQGLVGLQQVMLNRGIGKDGILRFGESLLVSNSSSLDLSFNSSSLSDRDGDGIVDYQIVRDEFTAKRINIYKNLSVFDRNDESRLGFAPIQPTSSDMIPNAPGYIGTGARSTRQIDLNFDKRSDYLSAVSDFAGLTLRGFYRSKSGLWQEFLNNTSGIPSSHTLDRPSSRLDNLAITLADMNGDRMQDYVALERQGGIAATLKVTYWPYCALGEWGAPRVMELSGFDTFSVDGADLRDLLVQDFTGDGLADVLWMNGSGLDSSITLRANIGGHQWSTPLIKEGLPTYRPRDATAPTTFRTADLNGNWLATIINPSDDD